LSLHSMCDLQHDTNPIEFEHFIKVLEFLFGNNHVCLFG